MVPLDSIIIHDKDDDDDGWYASSMTTVPSSWQAKLVAVTTVSQLLDASEDVFQEAAATDDAAFET